jgi:hypothetical protein
MFVWSRPNCPVDSEVMTWIEQRMNWLAGQFGWDQFVESEVILPIQEHFPALFYRSRKALHDLFEQVCEYVQVDPASVNLNFKSHSRLPDLGRSLFGSRRGL